MKHSNHVRIYFNLTRKVWSIQHHVPNKGWRLLAHTSDAILRDAVAKVYESGRQRVIKEGKKYVHAYIEGELIGTRKESHSGRKLGYNPYKNSTFIWKDDNSEAHNIGEVVFNNQGVFAR